MTPEPTPPDDWHKLIERNRRLTKDRSDIEAATIERCAQVADKMARAVYWDGETIKLLHEIAAAIRALKDQP